MIFPTIRIDGAILSADILENISQGEIAGQLAEDFGLGSNIKVKDEIAKAWADLLDYWRIFRRKLDSNEQTYGTTETRKFWVIPMLNLLGYDPIIQPQGEEVQGRNYTISHRERNDFPIHIVGWRDNLDEKRQGTNSLKISPHGLVQEYINLTEHVYAIITNGRTVRLLRDNFRLGELWCVEFDLERMLDEEIYADFAVFFRLLHASRIPQSFETASTCWLERYHQETFESQSAIREGLSEAVEIAVKALADGFLNHIENNALRNEFGLNNISPQEFYKFQLRLIYRILFLMVAEEREILYDASFSKTDEGKRLSNIYNKHYSLSRLRSLTDLRHLLDLKYCDAWLGLLDTFRFFESNQWGKELGLSPLNGSLFSNEAIGILNSCSLDNQTLLFCLRTLSVFKPKGQNRLIRINYKLLDVQEFGSVYEGLLDLRPVVSINDRKWAFTFAEGTDRKTTGSYYTQPKLVRELVRSALDPVIYDRLRPFQLPSQKDEAIKALLDIRICDPAVGSGHMLIAAARQLAQVLAQVSTGEPQPGKTPFREALREVIQHCIYGVDLNPDAVELCQVALWLESHNPGKPLSFLSHKIKHGNSLVGVVDISVLAENIPDEAFDPVTGDDIIVARLLKRQNREYRRQGQTAINFQQAESKLHLEQGDFAIQYQELDHLQQNSVADIEQLQLKYDQTRTESWLADWQACNIYTAAFLHTYTDKDDPRNPTSERLANYLKDPLTIDTRLLTHVNNLQSEIRFFHWPLEYPDIFSRGGFDVVIGNPPWETVELKEQEFFSTRDLTIAKASKAERSELIEKLVATNIPLSEEFAIASHRYDAQRKFIQASGRFKLTAFGRINTYSIFAELDRNLLNSAGRAGVIVQTGIATDDNNKAFFEDLITKNVLVSLFDFENREKLFAIHSSQKFCLLTMSGRPLSQDYNPQFAFFLTRTEHLQDPKRIFSLTVDDFVRLNPNTRTCPVFRTRQDADLTTRIYRRMPILLNEKTGENCWKVKFKQGLFNMSSDSKLFATETELKNNGFHLQGNHFINKEKGKFLPLYEGKMMMSYDHRFANVIVTDNIQRAGQSEDLTTADHMDPNIVPMPRYWVDENEVYLTLADVPMEMKRAFRQNDLNQMMVTIENWLHQYEFAKDSQVEMATNSLNEREAIILKSVRPFNCLEEISIFLKGRSPKWFIGFKDVTSATNERTFIATILPLSAVGHTIPILFPKQSSLLKILFYAGINTLVTDLIARQKIGGLHMTFFNVKQIPFLPPHYFNKSDMRFIVPRVLELTYTSWDLRDFFDDVWIESSHELRDEIISQWNNNRMAANILPSNTISSPFMWHEDRRASLRAEIDAYFARMYGLSTEDLRYVLDPQEVYGLDFPSETFRGLKYKDIRRYGEYRTRRLVLEAFAQLGNDVGADIPNEYIAVPSSAGNPNISTKNSLFNDFSGRAKKSNSPKKVKPKASEPLSINFDTNVRDLGVHTGIYTVTDAVNILNGLIRENDDDILLSQDKVRRWFKDLREEHYEGVSEDVTLLDGPYRISFHGLIELVAISALRNVGASLLEILKSRSELKKQTGKLYPFTVREELEKLRVYGRKIIQDRTTSTSEDDLFLTLDGTGQLNLALIERFLKAVDFLEVEGVTKALLPVKSKRLIVIDPNLSNGQPSIFGKGVSVSLIKRLYKGSESIPSLKRSHNLEEAEIMAAYDYPN